ncbi:MAG: sulfite exporter TauE/SafE family protein [Chitinophagaceae bacterium]|nr:MAG: sulfite exporter TauE/SafE family protein [Chitinophagaceae bacterium]
MSSEIIILCIAAFAAGFIDAIVGGGGLVQTPATLVTLPQYPIATLLGTTKIPSFTGTAIACYQYGRKVSLKWKLLLVMACIALLAAMAGSYTVSLVSNRFMKPVIFCVLIVVAIYTYSKKNFGTAVSKEVEFKKELLYGSLFALVVGFYDGFIGPGAGSFLVIFFIAALGYDFLRASAHAKFVNLATNLGSIIYFGGSGHILYQYAIPMAVFNITGSFLGARLAILKGNTFIRVFFLLVVAGTIIRFGYDIFLKAP